jgi:acyl-CoA thioester hydrolase
MVLVLSDFPVVIDQQVAWGEQDGFHHVNNVVYFRYFENARVEYLQRLGWHDMLKATGVGPIVATAQARFRRAVTFPDRLNVGVRVSTMSRDRYMMEYLIVSQKTGETTTIGETLVVAYDYRQHQKIAIPDDLRQRIEALENRKFNDD